MDVVGPALPVPYFTLLVLFGAFFAMQLLVAILSSKFAQLSAQVGNMSWVDLVIVRNVSRVGKLCGSACNGGSAGLEVGQGGVQAAKRLQAAPTVAPRSCCYH